MTCMVVEWKKRGIPILNRGVWYSSWRIRQNCGGSQAAAGVCSEIPGRSTVRPEGGSVQRAAGGLLLAGVATKRVTQ